MRGLWEIYHTIEGKYKILCIDRNIKIFNYSGNSNFELSLNSRVLRFLDLDRNILPFLNFF